MTGWSDSPVFVDTNILIYSIDSDAGPKHVRAKEVVERCWSTRMGIISTQILSEWSVNLRRKMKMPWPGISRIVRPYLVWVVVSIEPEDTIEALGIAERNGLSFWDALVVRAASKANVAHILTEDLNPGQVIEGVEIVSPFG